jgi:mRNA interferase MazF
MHKDFDSWNFLKKKLQTRNSIPSFKRKEIWWCNLGINIGSEQDGKGLLFSRPVLVITKISQQLFLGIPLSSKIKKDKFFFDTFYHIIHFKDKDQSAILAQIRTLEARRLEEKMGEISDSEFKKLMDKLKKMIFMQG